jgi:hypothetical protein
VTSVRWVLAAAVGEALVVAAPLLTPDIPLIGMVDGRQNTTGHVNTALRGCHESRGTRCSERLVGPAWACPTSAPLRLVCALDHPHHSGLGIRSVSPQCDVGGSSPGPHMR